MREHILSKFSKVCDYEGINNNYYDEVTQVSYRDSNLKHKVIGNGRTILTETIENSDEDEFRYQGPTLETAVVENSDADEFMSIGSTKTSFILETSDEDELYLGLWSEETRRIENSDADEFVC